MRTRSLATFVAVVMAATLSACSGDDEKSKADSSATPKAATPATSPNDVAVPKPVVIDYTTPKGKATSGMLLFSLSTSDADGKSCTIVGLKDNKAVILGSFAPRQAAIENLTDLTCGSMRQFAPDGSYAVTTTQDDKVAVIFDDGAGSGAALAKGRCGENKRSEDRTFRQAS